MAHVTFNIRWSDMSIDQTQLLMQVKVYDLRNALPLNEKGARWPGG